jgi:hypothetical protein
MSQKRRKKKKKKERRKEQKISLGQVALRPFSIQRATNSTEGFEMRCK